MLKVGSQAKVLLITRRREEEIKNKIFKFKNNLACLISSAYSGEITAINERAKQIIEEIRANNLKPIGENGKSVSRFEPPTELTELQKQKDEAALRYRDNFKTAIGEEAFSRFEQWVLGEFSKGFTVTDDKSPTLEDTTRELPQNNGFTPLNEVPKREIIINGGEDK